ncbi:hypothetical protein AB0L40_17870 [Patulibacter sp. NPDC049589]|uniref:calcium-binding protein n=1 Tax=Patulibacter sp. NPDC049589 TaxID=3154731 RepID=UPI003414466C
MSPLRILPLSLAVATALLVGAASAGAAGTATLDGTTVRFVDPVGAADDLKASISSVPQENDVERLGGWRVGFLQYDPATTPGAGCQVGFVSTICPTGGTVPGVAIDLGGGNDQLEIGTNPAAPGLKATIAGGPGDDEIEVYQTGGTIDGGAGDDVISPDNRMSINQFPPEPTPGGVIRGGGGTDTVEYSSVLTPIDVSLDSKANDGRKGEGDNVMPDVENVTGGPYGGALIGSAAANELTGGGSADRIVGGAGKDQLDGRGGNDTIDALDGAAGDRVTCGDGADVAYVDAGDLVTSEDVQGGTPCEKVVSAPGVSSSRLRFRSKRISVKLQCPKLSTATCSGRLRLSTPKGKKVASATYRVKRGKKATVALKARKRPARQAVLIVAPTGTAPIAGRVVSVR